MISKCKATKKDTSLCTYKKNNLFSAETHLNVSRFAEASSGRDTEKHFSQSRRAAKIKTGKNISRKVAPPRRSRKDYN